VSALKICPQCGTEYELDQRFCPKDGSTLRSQNAGGDLVGSVVADRYNVLKKLGEGGMGAVYLAEHVKMGRKSAVKVMNPGMASDPDAISRFNREAANASRINHPNVCAVYDFGETSDGLIYLAMEFIEGPSLTKVIEDLGALPPLRAADITRQAAEALAVAHDMGIVHRDLKPDNIMIARGRDGADVVKVVDFGIAKAGNAENQKVTKTGMVVGTPEYMSPEQLAGDKLDGRSDIYSLALVAFNMLTGKLPFPADTIQESMILRLTDRPRTLAEMKPEVAWPESVQAVLERALARSAADRYQNATDFGRELHEAIRAMPESEATSAFTAVMSPPAVVGEKKTTPIPATRVNTPTPAASATVPPRSGIRTPMLAGIAAVVLLLGGGGAYVALKGAGGAQAPAAPQGEQLNQPTATVPPAATRDFDAELARIASLADLLSATEASAAEALRKLDSLPASGLTHDQKVLAALLRAEANTVRGNNRAACVAVQGVQGASAGTRYESRVSFILENAC
jgi:eukaryotic-like serine/threonine-protein kinase